MTAPGGSRGTPQLLCSSTVLTGRGSPGKSCCVPSSSRGSLPRPLAAQVSGMLRELADVGAMCSGGGPRLLGPPAPTITCSRLPPLLIHHHHPSTTSLVGGSGPLTERGSNWSARLSPVTSHSLATPGFTGFTGYAGLGIRGRVSRRTALYLRKVALLRRGSSNVPRRAGPYRAARVHRAALGHPRPRGCCKGGKGYQRNAGKRGGGRRVVWPAAEAAGWPLGGCSPPPPAVAVYLKRARLRAPQSPLRHLLSSGLSQAFLGPLS